MAIVPDPVTCFGDACFKQVSFINKQLTQPVCVPEVHILVYGNKMWTSQMIENIVIEEMYDKVCQCWLSCADNHLL